MIPGIGFQQKGWLAQDSEFIDDVERNLDTGRFQWMGELLLRHYGVPELDADSYDFSPDTDLFRRVLDLSARYGVPLTVHHESEQETRGLFKEVLIGHPEAIVVWAHWCGRSTADEAREFLEELPNLHCDTGASGVSRRYGREKNPLFVSQLVWDPDWRDLIEEMPDRFLFAVDAVVAVHYSKYGNLIKEYPRAFDRLSDEVRSLVLGGNALRLMSGVVPPSAESTTTTAAPTTTVPPTTTEAPPPRTLTPLDQYLIAIEAVVAGDMAMVGCLAGVFGLPEFLGMQGRLPNDTELVAAEPCIAGLGGVSTLGEAESGSADPGVLEEPETTSCVPLEPGDYERPERDYLLGARIYSANPFFHSVTTGDEIKELGFNAVSLLWVIPYDENGHILYPSLEAGTERVSLEDSLCHLFNKVHEMKEAGLSVFLQGEPNYRFQGPTEPGPLDPNIVSMFASELHEVMVPLALAAEKYKVDWLSPIGEPDKWFGPQAGSDIGQQILPFFSDFSGKLLYQVAAFDDYRIDLLGYDIAGLVPLGCDGDYEISAAKIRMVTAWAAEDGLDVANAEFGCTNNPSPETMWLAIENMNRWYELTADKSVGLFVDDTPSVIPNHQSLTDDWISAWIREHAELRGIEPIR